jgi:ABC-2 type transport system ATP-binding protein
MKVEEKIIMAESIVLQTFNLVKRFGASIAVDNLSLEIREGEVFGFLGPNGAGKTTSINMICGLLKPDAGKVLVHNKELKADDEETRTKIGVCPQEIVLWERLTCMEQLQFIGRMYGIEGKEAKKRAEHLLDDLNLIEKKRSQARTLSGGMKRRLNLAMALVHDPEIVILDEPEAGLDPQSRVLVRDYIHSLARKKTIILTTHNMDEADRVADRVAIIDHGRLLMIDTPANLKRQVGEGDALEITLTNPIPADKEVTIMTALRNITPEVHLHEDRTQITARALDIVNRLGAIIDTLHEYQIATGDVRLRENTLEDAFIQLTGRRLRE